MEPPRLREVIRRHVHVLATGLLLLGACMPAPSAPNVMAPQASAMLRAIPIAHGLGVGERRTVRAVVEDGNEHIASVAIAERATIDDPSIAILEGSTLVGVAPGSTSLRITDTPRSGTVVVPIVVTSAVPISLALEPIAPCRIGQRVGTRATVLYGDGVSGDVTLDTHWFTPEPDRLFVPDTPDTRGAVAPIRDKPATLHARFGELETSVEIAPSFGEPSGIVVRIAWSYGGIRRFGAFAHWSDRNEYEVSAGCLWRVGNDAPFRGLERVTLSPRVPVAELSWSRVATCELATSSARGSLFAP